MKNYIRDVIDRYIKHDYPEEVNQDFRTWLTDEERADEKEHELNKLWEATEAVTTPGYRDSLERMHELTGIGSRRRIYSLRTRLVVWRVAAALLITVSSISIYLALQNRQAPDLLQAYIPTAETRNITLPDGTQVLINSQSTLLYPQQFKGDTRCVYLVGEAGFKVKRDEEHPFIVKSSDFQVTALGTEFNVTAYPDEEEVTATLISGKVLVEYNNQQGQEILKPNEQLAYNKRTRSGNVLHPDMQDVTAWQRGEIVFRSMTLEEIFTRLERKYPYTFVYSFRSLKEDRFNLTFGQNASMEEVMGALSEQYQKDNEGVKVTYDPTGSGTGIEEAKNGNTDIGLASRALKDDEKDGLEQKVIALDGISVIVNAKNGVKDLTTQQVADIFSGKITDWSQVGGKSGKISCIGRESGSGTRDGFESATGTEDKCKLEQELTSTGAVISAVGSNEKAIGYASFSAVEGQDKIQGIKINGVTCTEDTIKDGSYKLQRPFCFITKKDGKLSEEAQKVYDFATSKDAADLIRNAGAVPVSES